MTDEPLPSDTDIAQHVADRLGDDTVAARVYDTVANLYEPAPLDDICDLALCDPEDATPIVELLVELGVARRTEDDADGTPQFCRNATFFRCRRAMELAEEFTIDEMDDIQDRFARQVDAFKSVYNAETIEGIGQYSSNAALREYVQQDIEQWRLMQQTCDDIDVARVLSEDESDE